MLKLMIGSDEKYNEETNEFVTAKSQVICLEHSLVSLSKWEAIWHKPFLDKKEKTFEETLDYIRCMTITKEVDPDLYKKLDSRHLSQVKKYIDDTMTATTLPKNTGPKSREIITSELIYYWMVAFTIPFECQKWHLNRLLTLINVCNIKNTPPKKMGRKELMRRNSALNAARKQSLNTRG